jgi:maltose O-acetyltransferase
MRRLKYETFLLTFFSFSSKNFIYDSVTKNPKNLNLKIPLKIYFLRGIIYFKSILTFCHLKFCFVQDEWQTRCIFNIELKKKLCRIALMTMYERMINELPYKGDSQTKGMMLENKKRIYEFNNLSPEHWNETESILKNILGKAGDGVYIEQPFHCDYGKHIEVGKNFYANYNLVILDVAKVTIGDCVMCGPNVSIYTAGHPLHPEARNSLYEYGIAVTIGCNVWIGANSVILPGVHVGNNVVIGAGSLVTKDLPDNTLCFGSPCRVVRKITEDDKKFYFKDRKFDIDFTK